MKNFPILLLAFILSTQIAKSSPGCYCFYTPNVNYTSPNCTSVKLQINAICYDQPASFSFYVTMSTSATSFPMPGNLYTFNTATISMDILFNGLIPNTIYYFKVYNTDCPNKVTQFSIKTLNGSSNCTIPVSYAATNIKCASFIANFNNQSCYLVRYFTLKNTTNSTILYNRYVLTRQNNLLLSNLATGNYEYFIEAVLLFSCSGLPSFKLIKSNTISVDIINDPPDAGPDLVLEGCEDGVRCVTLNAKGNPGKWTIINPLTPNGNNFFFELTPGKLTSTDPKAKFCMSKDAPVAVLRWTTICGSDEVGILSSTFFNSCGSISNPMSMQDTRDNKNYPTIKIGNKCWFAKNLDFGTQYNFYGNNNSSTQEPPWPANANSTVYKYCWGNQASNCSANGALYLGDFASKGKLCPPCWHVASTSEWQDLIKSVNLTTQYPTVLDNLVGNAPLGFNAYTSGTNNGWLNALFADQVSYQDVQGLLCYNGNTSRNGCFDNRIDNNATKFWTSSSTLMFPNSLSPDSPAPSWLTKYSNTRSGYGNVITIWGSQSNSVGSRMYWFNDWFNRDHALPVRCIRD